MDSAAAYGKLAAWARASGQPLKETEDPVTRAEELSLFIAKLRLTKTHAPQEPDRSSVRTVMLAYLSARGETAPPAAEEDRRIGEALETLVTAAAAKIIRFKENQPYFGCGGTKTPKNKPLG